MSSVALRLLRESLGFVFSMEETWKDSPYFCSDFEVSDMGRVRWKQTSKEVAITTRTNMYCVVSLHGTQFRVSRLVAMAFIPNPENKPHVDHINGVRNDNRASNLRWASAKENMNNPITIERLRKSKTGEKNPNYGKVYTEEEKLLLSKLLTGRKVSDKTRMKISLKVKKRSVNQYSPDGTLIKRWPIMKMAADFIGVWSSTIVKHCTINEKPLRGYLWCYADDIERIKKIESLHSVV